MFKNYNILLEFMYLSAIPLEGKALAFEIMIMSYLLMLNMGRIEFSDLYFSLKLRYNVQTRICK